MKLVSVVATLTLCCSFLAIPLFADDVDNQFDLYKIKEEKVRIPAKKIFKNTVVGSKELYGGMKKTPDVTDQLRLTKKNLIKATSEERANTLWTKLTDRLETLRKASPDSALGKALQTDITNAGGETGLKGGALGYAIFGFTSREPEKESLVSTFGQEDDKAMEDIWKGMIETVPALRPTSSETPGGEGDRGSKTPGKDNPHGGKGKAGVKDDRPIAPTATMEWGRWRSGGRAINDSYLKDLRSGDLAKQWAAADWLVNNFTAEQIEKALAEPDKYGLPVNSTSSDNDGFDILTAANRANRESSPAKLREWAYDSGAGVTGALKRAASRELLRRTNLGKDKDAVGAAMRDDFRFIRPELLLPYQADAGGKDAKKAADALADLMGSQNTAALTALAKKEAGGSSDEAKAYSKRARCAAHLVLAQRQAADKSLTLPDGFVPAPDKACEGIDDFKKAFDEKFKEIAKRNKDARAKVNAVTKASGNKEGENKAIKDARRWFFEEKDPKTGKPRFTYENILDYLSQRVATAKNPKTPEKERKAAYDEAVALGKIIAWKDPTSGEYVLDVKAKDAGFTEGEKHKSNQSVVLGSSPEQIFAGLSRFDDRGVGPVSANDQTASTPLRRRSRLQSFAVEPDHRAHMGRSPQILTAAADDPRGFGTATIGTGGVTRLGNLATAPRDEVVASSASDPEEPDPKRTTDSDTTYVGANYDSAVAKCLKCHEGAAVRTAAQIRRVATRLKMNGSDLGSMGTDHGDPAGDLNEAEIRALRAWAAGATRS